MFSNEFQVRPSAKVGICTAVNHSAGPLIESHCYSAAQFEPVLGFLHTCGHSKLGSWVGMATLGAKMGGGFLVPVNICFLGREHTGADKHELIGDGQKVQVAQIYSAGIFGYDLEEISRLTKHPTVSPWSVAVVIMERTLLSA